MEDLLASKEQRDGYGSLMAEVLVCSLFVRSRGNIYRAKLAKAISIEAQQLQAFDAS